MPSLVFRASQQRAGGDPAPAGPPLADLLPPGPSGGRRWERAAALPPSPLAAAPWEAWSLGSGVPHSQFLGLCPSSSPWSQREGHSPGATDEAGGRGGGRLAAGGPGGLGSDAMSSSPRGVAAVCPQRAPHCPFPGPRGPPPGPAPHPPACHGWGSAAHLGSAGSGCSWPDGCRKHSPSEGPALLSCRVKTPFCRNWKGGSMKRGPTAHTRCSSGHFPLLTMPDYTCPRFVSGWLVWETEAGRGQMLCSR